MARIDWNNILSFCKERQGYWSLEFLKWIAKQWKNVHIPYNFPYIYNASFNKSSEADIRGTVE